MLSRYVEQLLNVYNYIDGIVITDNTDISSIIKITGRI